VLNAARIAAVSGYRLRGRLARLERWAPRQGACSVCGGSAGFVRIVERESESEQPTPCPSCGRPPFIFTLRFERPAGENRECY
jgi:hypothetical protein